MLKNEPAAVLVAAALCLAACGKSTDARRTEAVKCGAFVQGLTAAQIAEGTPLQGAVTTAFVEAIGKQSAGHPSDDQGKLVGLTSLGDSLTAQIDAARAQAAQQDGVQDLIRLAKAKDAAGAVSYLDGCVENRDRLLADAR